MLKRPLTSIELKSEDLDCMKTSLREFLITQANANSQVSLLSGQSNSLDGNILSPSKKRLEAAKKERIRCSSGVQDMNVLVSTHGISEDAVPSLSNNNNNNNVDVDDS